MGMSKTGLLESLRIPLPEEYLPRCRDPGEMVPLSGPAPVVLRPFAGIHNPFPYGCSVLCNHPADLEARHSLRHKTCGDSWFGEGSNEGMTREEALLARRAAVLGGRFGGGATRASFLSAPPPTDDWVPEELFRKYTETDSRPATPAPTLASVGTKGTSMARRCLTPDPHSVKERTTLVLDLRRSHSQEALCWRGMVTPVPLLPPPSPPQPRWSPPRPPLNSKAAQGRRMRANNRQHSPQPRRSRSRRGEIKEGERRRSSSVPSLRFKSPEPATTPRVSAGGEEQEVPLSPGHNITPRRLQQASQQAMVRRRGKHRRPKKHLQRDVSPGKEVTNFEEPGETQVRGSSALVGQPGGGTAQISSTFGVVTGAQDSITALSRGEDEMGVTQYRSFLHESILAKLQRQLSWEHVEAETDRKRRVALAEALRAPRVRPDSCAELKALAIELQKACAPSKPELWASVPRAFSRKSAQFELPLDSNSLRTLSPLNYLRDHVRVTSQRRLLYSGIFNLHREDSGMENEAKLIHLERVPGALADILGFPLTPDELSTLSTLLDLSLSPPPTSVQLDLRTFCGLAALVERLLGSSRALLDSKEVDPCSHLEKADFGCLESRVERVGSELPLCRLLKAVLDA